MTIQSLFRLAVMAFLLTLGACATKIGAPSAPSSDNAAPQIGINTKPAKDVSASSSVPNVDTEGKKEAQVMTGEFQCTGGKILSMLRDEKAIDTFVVRYHTQPKPYLMKQVATTSGAWRFEDKMTGMVVLQLANKSMLLNEKQGKIVDNDCKNAIQHLYDQSPAQQAANQRLSN